MRRRWFLYRRAEVGAASVHHTSEYRLKASVPMTPCLSTSSTLTVMQSRCGRQVEREQDLLISYSPSCHFLTTSLNFACRKHRENTAGWHQKRFLMLTEVIGSHIKDFCIWFSQILLIIIIWSYDMTFCLKSVMLFLLFSVPRVKVIINCGDGWAVTNCPEASLNHS